MSKRNVCFVSQEEPEFIQKLKNKIGYKEDKVDIQDKFAKNEDSEEIDKSKMAKPRRPVDSDDEEYKPQIVVLENSNVTQADIATCKASATEEDEEPTGGRIIFKKPTKRKPDTKDPALDRLSKKLSLDKSEGSTGIKRNLLSFDVEE